MTKIISNNFWDKKRKRIKDDEIFKDKKVRDVKFVSDIIISTCKKKMVGGDWPAKKNRIYFHPVDPIELKIN
jgi:hypothetical protein